MGNLPVARVLGALRGRYYADGNDAIHIVPDSRNQPANSPKPGFRCW